jgi:hypothetical protein
MLSRNYIREPGHCKPIRDVEAMSRYANTSEHLCRARQPSFLYICECEITASTRQRRGNRSPDAARRARDYSGSSSELHTISHA